MIVLNQIGIQLIDLLSDCFSDWEVLGFTGEAGAQGERQKAQSFYNNFSPMIQATKTTELRIRKNLKAAKESQIKYFKNSYDISKEICL